MINLIAMVKKEKGNIYARIFIESIILIPFPILSTLKLSIYHQCLHGVLFIRKCLNWPISESVSLIKVVE